MNAYRHLTIADRYWIEYSLEEGMSYARIARMLRVNRSTVQREVSRNSRYGVYNHESAHYKSLRRKLRGRMPLPKGIAVRPQKFRPRRGCLSHYRLTDRRRWRCRRYNSWRYLGKTDRRTKRPDQLGLIRWPLFHRLRKYTYYRESLSYKSKYSRLPRQRFERQQDLKRKFLIPPWDNSTSYLTGSPPQLKQSGPGYYSFSKQRLQASEKSLKAEVRPMNVKTCKIPPFTSLFQLVLFKNPLFTTDFSQKSPEYRQAFSFSCINRCSCCTSVVGAGISA